MEAVIRTNVTKGMFLEASHILLYGAYHVETNESGVKTYVRKKNDTLVEDFARLCEMYWICVQPFQCVRAWLVAKFTFNVFDVARAQAKTCYDLKGSVCSGCINSHHDNVCLNGKQWTKVDLKEYIKAIQLDVLNLLSSRDVVTWTDVEEGYDESNIFLVAWAILELLVVHQKITLKIDILEKKYNVKVKDILVSLREESRRLS